MGHTPTYREFLRAKVRLAPRHGFDVKPAEINPALKDFVKAIVRWAASGGRRGIFSSFGLHKTSTQIELARLALKRQARPLIVVPLGVRHEFFDEAAERFTGDHAVNLVFIRSTSEIDLTRTDVIYLTNYESVRESKIDLALFGFASLDEAAVLRGFGGTKTEKIKQIGNAVSVAKMKACVGAIMADAAPKIAVIPPEMRSAAE